MAESLYDIQIGPAPNKKLTQEDATRWGRIAGLKEARELLHRQEPWMLVSSFKASLDNRIAELERGK